MCFNSKEMQVMYHLFTLQISGSIKVLCQEFIEALDVTSASPQKEEAGILAQYTIQRHKQAV